MTPQESDPKEGDAENQYSPKTTVEKVIVAVHGIGDQFSYETIQTVARQICGYFGDPSGIPLGSFHSEKLGEHGVLVLASPPYKTTMNKFLFAETYWAGIPRGPIKEGYIIEESKKWARTIVERIRLNSHDAGTNLSTQDYLRIETVLEEMIETIKVLERLFFIAEKAGVFKFDLQKVLADYVADVQIVTEFKGYRDKILAQFSDVMRRINKAHPDAEIYIVAHSEGTVISFLGLLDAMCKQPKQPDAWKWIGRVRGYLTLGSPIDKHLLLWPELWKKFEKDICQQRWAPDSSQKPIQWRNFYDFGDPIGFELDSARTWMSENGWNQQFQFEPGHDKGFSRYYFPGKAHIDYWGDDKLFGHFIQTVVKEPALTADGQPKDFADPPGNTFLPKIVSTVVPYAIVAVLLLLAVYVIYKAVGTEEGESARDIFTNVGALTGLLAGITLVARIPRLTQPGFWHVVGFGFFAVFAFIYQMLESSNLISKAIDDFPSLLFGGLATATGISATILLATAVAIVVYLLNKLFPKWGLYTLLIPGFVAVTCMVGYSVAFTEDRDSKWPVVLALAGFLYLWWLAALLFDLIFVWQRYIRFSVALSRLREITATKRPPDTIGRNMEGPDGNLVTRK